MTKSGQGNVAQTFKKALSAPKNKKAPTMVPGKKKG